LYQPYATYHSTLTQTANPTFLNVPGFFQSELRYKLTISVTTSPIGAQFPLYDLSYWCTASSNQSSAQDFLFVLFG
jgi:hypothetical protein